MFKGSTLERRISDVYVCVCACALNFWLLWQWRVHIPRSDNFSNVFSPLTKEGQASNGCLELIVNAVDPDDDRQGDPGCLLAVDPLLLEDRSDLEI